MASYPGRDIPQGTIPRPYGTGGMVVVVQVVVVVRAPSPRGDGQHEEQMMRKTIVVAGVLWGLATIGQHAIDAQVSQEFKEEMRAIGCTTDSDCVEKCTAAARTAAEHEWCFGTDGEE